ncbi:beta-1 adrenergic receptor-like [Montipora capricornis]|uniref:beta-1 adrenergic receptor-like n=1 Tax=Montipora capricornis TaxID=246305 RepID=UPI0035F0FC36
MSLNDDFDPLAFSIQITYLVIIFVIAVSGNGLVCCVVYRHKRLRTIPNFFIVNLSVIDLCNSLINMPLFAGYHVIETQFFQDKFVFIVCSSLYRFTQFLSLQTLLVIMMDRYGAIKYQLRYHVWKTKAKAYYAIAFIWFSGAVLTMVGTFRTDQILALYERLTFAEYFRIMFENDGWKVSLCVIGFTFIGLTILGFQVCRAVRSSRRKIEAIGDGDGSSEQGRKALNLLRMRELQTTRNVALIVVAYVFTYLPGFLYALLVRMGIFASWAKTFLLLFRFSCSACNPIVYCLRTSRFREAVKELLKCNSRKKRAQGLSMMRSNVTHQAARN